jgi:hypothetical protein
MPWRSRRRTAGGVGVRVEPLPVAGEDDLVELREPVVGELEVAERNAALGGFHALPGRERDREVGLVLVQRLVRGGIERRDREVALAAVRLDDGLQRRHLVGVAEAGVGLAVEVARPLEGPAGQDADRGRGLLQDRRDAHDVGAGRRRERERVLEADAALRLVGGQQRLRRGRCVGRIWSLMPASAYQPS